jgi:diphthine-ammonia ligase
MAGIVTGDVYDVALHEAGWLDRVCKEVGLEPVKPLWHRDTQQILSEFIATGFKATVVRVKTDVLGIEWLGRQVNKEFLDDLLKLGTVDPCGERGEFHTFVTDGPLFKQRIEILESAKATLNGYGHLEVKRFEVKPKGS